MPDFMVFLFFLLVLALMFLVYKYFSAISDVVELGCVHRSDTQDKSIRDCSKLFLLSNPVFLVSLYTRSYARGDVENREYVARMDRARKFLMLQYPLAILIFALPILSKLFLG